MRGQRTEIKDLKPGDVIRCFDGLWNRAIVSKVWQPYPSSEHLKDFWVAKVWRPHMHLNTKWDSTQPATRYEIFTICGSPVDVLTQGCREVSK